jgi:hypothetical protein
MEILLRKWALRIQEVNVMEIQALWFEIAENFIFGVEDEVNWLVNELRLIRGWQLRHRGLNFEVGWMKRNFCNGIKRKAWGILRRFD